MSSTRHILHRHCDYLPLPDHSLIVALTTVRTRPLIRTLTLTNRATHYPQPGLPERDWIWRAERLGGGRIPLSRVVKTYRPHHLAGGGVYGMGMSKHTAGPGRLTECQPKKAEGQHGTEMSPGKENIRHRRWFRLLGV